MKKLRLIKSKDKDTLDITEDLLVDPKDLMDFFENSSSIDIRGDGLFAKRGIYLDDKINGESIKWVIGKDDEELTVLLPLKA